MNREKLETIALTLLRVTVGVVMVVHGWGKWNDIPGTMEAFGKMGIPSPDIAVYLAIAGELGGGLGLLIGFLTPLAAFGIFCVMAVAITQVHLSNGLLLSKGGFEYPLVLAAVALYFMAKGAGCISLDAKIFGKCKRPEAASSCCG